MSVSTNAYLCYGIVFPEEYEFPWDAEPYHGDIDEWWLWEAIKFKPTVEVFTPEGNYLEGMNEKHPLVEQYYEEQDALIASNPLPVELVNYCSASYPQYILAAPSTIKVARRGNPTTISSEYLDVPEKAYRDLLAFVILHKLTFNGMNPGWVLASYWGE